MAIYPREERVAGELEVFAKKVAIVAGLGILLALLWAVREIVILIFLAAVLAAGIAPAVKRVRVLGRYWLHRNINRGTAVMIVYAFAGAFLFGLFLATVAITGLEPQQAFAVLGHPGFKHFVRVCISPSGKIEAWAIGKDDALAPGDPALIDHWSWAGEIKLT